MNKERGKLGSCFDYQMTDTVSVLCAVSPCPDHISPPWLQLFSRFALLCSTLSFAGPQRNWVFAFYICFVQMSVDSFPCASYQGLYAHFINRQKALVLHARCIACDSSNVLYSTCICVPVIDLFCYFYQPAMPNCLMVVWCWYAFYKRWLLCGNHQRYKHVINTTLPAHTAIKEEEPRFKADTFTFPTAFRCQKSLTWQPLFILLVDELYNLTQFYI